MSKKHYTAIAQRYHEIYIKEYDVDIHDTHVAKRVFDDMVSALADMFSDDNAAFDRERFTRALYHGV